MADPLLLGFGVALILIGFAALFIAVIWLALSGSKGGKSMVRGGGAVIIGPIPIIFGKDKESVKMILILSIVLVSLLLIFTLFSHGVLR